MPYLCYMIGLLARDNRRKLEQCLTSPQWVIKIQYPIGLHVFRLARQMSSFVKYDDTEMIDNAIISVLSRGSGLNLPEFVISNPSKQVCRTSRSAGQLGL